MKNKVFLLRSLILVGIAIAVLASVFFREKQINKTTDTWSFEFEKVSDKLAFLSEYLIMHSKVIDTEYHIVYFDNSTGIIPAPSDWDIRVALKVKEEDIHLWLDGFTEVLAEEINLSWWDALVSYNIVFDDANAKYYKREGSFSYLVIFPDENVILKAVSTMSYNVSWSG